MLLSLVLRLLQKVTGLNVCLCFVFSAWSDFWQAHLGDFYPPSSPTYVSIVDSRQASMSMEIVKSVSDGEW